MPRALLVFLLFGAAASPSAYASPPPAPPKASTTGTTSRRAAAPKALFNGRDLRGWTAHFDAPGATAEQAWSVKGGVLHGRGQPVGYLCTTETFTNYELELEWRFERPGNSGVLLRMTGPDKVWPRSVEAQLQHGEAGDFWLIDGAPLDTPRDRVDRETPRHRLRTRTNERPLGQWNRYRITVSGDRITLRVNGAVLNEGTGAEVVAGRICLQSEGAAIQFRNVRLQPLP